MIIATTAKEPVLPWIAATMKRQRSQPHDCTSVSRFEANGALKTTRMMNALQALDGDVVSSTATVAIGVIEPFSSLAIQPIKCLEQFSIVVHGEIENLDELLNLVNEKGYPLEGVRLPGIIICCMIDWYMNNLHLDLSLVEALGLVIEDLNGSVQLAIMDVNEKDTVYLTRKNSSFYIYADGQSTVRASNLLSAFDAGQAVAEIGDGIIAKLHDGCAVLYDYHGMFELAQEEKEKEA